MQRASNPSNIKIQMNNFTLNLQTLLSKDIQQLPTTQRKANKTERRTKSNFQDISPLKVKKKNKEKQYATIKNKSKKQEIFYISKMPSKSFKPTKDKKQTQPFKKSKKAEPKTHQKRSKSRNDKRSRLERHFTDYDHIIESARLRTSPSQINNQYNFHSESISKSASQSRSKSYKKNLNEKEKDRQKSRSKSIFSAIKNQRLNTQRSISKVKTKKENFQKQLKQQSTEKQFKKRRSSKSNQRQRKSIENYKPLKSKSRERFHTQVFQRHPLDDRHFNSDHGNQNDEKVFISNKKSKNKFEKLNEYQMSNSSDLRGQTGSKFTSNKVNLQEKQGEKSETKKRSKKLSVTVSAANIKKVSQNLNDKQSKLKNSKKLPSKESKKQPKQKSLDSQYEFYHSIKIEKKRLTEEGPDFHQKTTAKKAKILKTENDHASSNKYQPGEYSGVKKIKKDDEDGSVIQKAFKKKKKAADIIDRLFAYRENSIYQSQQKAPKQKKKISNESSQTQRLNIEQKSQNNTQLHHRLSTFSTTTKMRQFPQVKKLTIMTDFNQVESKQIYFDDISKILLKQQNDKKRDSKQSMSRSEMSIKDEVVQSRKGSVSHEWDNANQEKKEGESMKNAEIRRRELNDDEGAKDKFGQRMHDYGKTEQHYKRGLLGKEEGEIRKIISEDLDYSSEEYQSIDESLQEQLSPGGKLSKSKQESSHQLDQLEELNNHLEKLIDGEYSKTSEVMPKDDLQRYSSDRDFKTSSSNDLSIREEASFGLKPVLDNKQYPNSFTLIHEHKNNRQNFNETLDRNLTDTKQKKAISSTFIKSISQNQTMKYPIYSPSSYAMQNKHKVINSLLNKPRKSVEEQFQIAKTLSKKRLLEELELLDTLQKIEKSLENSLVHEGGLVKGYFGMGKQEDNILSEIDQKRNHHSSREHFQSKEGEEKDKKKNQEEQKGKHIEKIKLGNKNRVQFDSPEQEEFSNMQHELLLQQVHKKPVRSPQTQLAIVKQFSDNFVQKSLQTLLLTSEGPKIEQKSFEKQQKQDSPLLSNTSNQFKRSPVRVPQLNKKQLKVDPFEHSYEEIENFFSNNSCRKFQQQEDQIRRLLNGGNTYKSNRPQNSRGKRNIDERLNNSDEDEEFEFGNSHVEKKENRSETNPKKKNNYSDLTLQFEKEMDDYLKGSQKTSAKTKLQQVMSNPNMNTLKQSKSSSLSQEQNQTLQKSDDFFYYNNTSNAKPSLITEKSLHTVASSQKFDNSELIKSQLCTEIENRLLKEFCEYLTKHKEILHSYLYFISKCNLVVVGEGDEKERLESERQKRQQRQINEEKFMEYLQSKIYASNDFIVNLGSQAIGFVKRSPENQQIFLRNINKSFGIQPLKTLKWMRKIYAEEENKTGNEQRGEDEEEEEDNDEQNNEIETMNNQDDSVSGLSDCESVEAAFPPTLLADFDAYQSQNVFEEMNQEQFYLNHAVYAALNEICDKYRPFGENGYPVIAKQKPKLTTSIDEVEPKIMKRLKHLLSLRWGRMQFAPDEQPQKVITETYKTMDQDIRVQDDERWSQRNMDDTIFENVYYLVKHVIDAIFNQEVIELYRMIEK